MTGPLRRGRDAQRQVMDISVVLPVFNEKENLLPLLDELEGVLAGTGKDYEVIAVDDGSNDGSVDILRSVATERKRVKAIFFRKNCGQAAAFDAGFRAARGDVVVTMDADRQNDPADIPRMLTKL